MTQGNKYCTGCGTPVVPGARFCSTCGKPQEAGSSAPVNAAPVFTPAPAAAPYAEAIIGVLPGLIRKKGLAVEGLNIIVTQRRMIFAVTTNDMMKEEAKQAGKEGGFFGAILNAATMGQTFYKRYLTMPPDAALAETPQNFAVELSQITGVRLAEGKEIINYGGLKANAGSPIRQHRYENGKLEIDTASGRYAYDVPNSSITMVADTLKKAGLYRG
jgi:hypothetical protein